MKKILSVILALAMMLCFASCGTEEATGATIRLTDTDGTELYSWNVDVSAGLTAGQYLEDCLTEDGIEYTVDGSMLNSVGERANDTDAWTVFWSVYVNGEYGQVGLWEQPVVEGDVIEVKYEESQW